MTLPISPSQTIGPFSHEAWRWACAASESAGGAIIINGILRDGDGAPVDDAMIEAWSPGAAAAEEGATLPGFRREPTDEKGEFSMRLARPASGEPAALVTIFARGLLLHQFTAVFLNDDDGLAASGMLRQVPAERRATLVARRTGAAIYAWEINLQGAHETVFFDYE
ncbi:protocatechuate 3,4-dioxygenase [Massilia cavernae]|uniref:Protocatechuate 3,4-dioxygenase n=1 Tax=Massilia cavernae TaxID=2320864 RepID=A0A418XGN0_9BURK|nr:protocatechuate 3,4-dioxygenase [Massilia cavernae]RJG11607.1 protocatechuate 3,4-dioxygenase [Massilia cavernae]